MLSFWARYVILKEEKQGEDRETILQLIESKFGAEKRQEIETKLAEII